MGTEVSLSSFVALKICPVKPPYGSADSSFVHTELREFCRNTPFHCENVGKVKNHIFTALGAGKEHMSRAGGEPGALLIEVSTSSLAQDPFLRWQTLPWQTLVGGRLSLGPSWYPCL